MLSGATASEGRQNCEVVALLLCRVVVIFSCSTVSIQRRTRFGLPVVKVHLSVAVSVFSWLSALPSAQQILRGVRGARQFGFAALLLPYRGAFFISVDSIELSVCTAVPAAFELFY